MSLDRSIQMSMNGGIKILRVNFFAKMDIQGTVYRLDIFILIYKKFCHRTANTKTTLHKLHPFDG